MNITNALPNSQTHNFTINNFVIEKQNATVFVTQDDINQVVDYYPYGKVLREYVNGDQERYLTTQHERDQATGLDYRGARYYDSDVARFLALDPLAAQFPGWSAYNYVMVHTLDNTATKVFQYWSGLKRLFKFMGLHTLHNTATKVFPITSSDHSELVSIFEDINALAVAVDTSSSWRIQRN